MEIHLPVSYSTFEKQFEQIKHHQTLPEILEDGIMPRTITIPFDNIYQENITEFKEQTDGEFGYLMLCKFKAIHNSLLNEDLVTYIDGDITIKKDFDRPKIQNTNKKN